MTRLSPDQVKAFFLHPDRPIRNVAARYFTDAHAPDPTVMPLLVQAYERFGLRDAFWGGLALEHIPQTADTLDWLLSKANDENRTGRRFEYALVRMEPDLLRPRAADVRWLLGEPEEAMLDRRLELATWDESRLWKALEPVFEVASELDSDERNDAYHELDDLAEALARHPNAAGRALELLARRFAETEDVPERDIWELTVAVRIAGDMRLNAAAEHIVKHMQQDWEMVDIEASRALVRIGTDDVIRAIAADFDPKSDNGTGFKTYATDPLGHIHTDLALETAVRLFDGETDPRTRDWIGATAVLEQLSVEATRHLLAARIGRETELGIAAVAVMLGIESPQVSRLWEQAKKNEEKWRKMEEEDGMAMTEPMPVAPPPVLSASQLPGYDSPLSILGKTADAGRNDKCPCGSGKKYKKCCLGKKRV